MNGLAVVGMTIAILALILLGVRLREIYRERKAEKETGEAYSKLLEFLQSIGINGDPVDWVFDQTKTDKIHWRPCFLGSGNFEAVLRPGISLRLEEYQILGIYDYSLVFVDMTKRFGDFVFFYFDVSPPPLQQDRKVMELYFYVADQLSKSQPQ